MGILYNDGNSPLPEAHFIALLHITETRYEYLRLDDAVQLTQPGVCHTYHLFIPGQIIHEVDLIHVQFGIQWEN